MEATMMVSKLTKLLYTVIIIIAIVVNTAVTSLLWYRFYPKRPFEFLLQSTVSAVNYRYAYNARIGVSYLQEMTEEDQREVIGALQDLDISRLVPQLHPSNWGFLSYRGYIETGFIQIVLKNGEYIYYDLCTIQGNSPYYERFWGRDILIVRRHHSGFEGGEVKNSAVPTDLLIMDTPSSRKAMETLRRVQKKYINEYGHAPDSIYGPHKIFT